MYWISKGSLKDRVQSYKKNEQSIKNFRIRVSEALIGKSRLEVKSSEDFRLKIIGLISGCEPPDFDYIGVLIKGSKVIPFRIQSPLALTELDSVPIISLCITHVGFDLNKLARHRDWSPSYDRNVFSDKDFHGYEFESESELKEVKFEIQKGIKKLFLSPLIENKPLAYCVEACFWGKEWPYKYKSTTVTVQETNSIYTSSSNYAYENSNYRTLFSLCDFLGDAIDNCKLNARISRYISDHRRNKDYLLALKTKKAIEDGQEIEIQAKRMSNFFIKVKEMDDEEKSMISSWLNNNEVDKLTADSLLNQFEEWIKENKTPSFKWNILKIINLKNNKVANKVFEMQKTAIERAKKEAGELIA